MNIYVKENNSWKVQEIEKAFGIKMIEIQSFYECPTHTNNLMGGTPILINLGNVENDTARKCFDFLTGATYALRGNVQKIAQDTFCFLPEKKNAEKTKGSCIAMGNNDEHIAGFRELNRLTTELHKDDLVILGSKPGLGKTELALLIALNTAMKDDALIAIFYLEISESSIAQKIFSLYDSVDFTYAKNGSIFIEPKNESFVKSPAQELPGLRIFVADTLVFQFDEIKSKCENLKQKEGKLDLVIIDYMQLINYVYKGKTILKDNSQKEKFAVLMPKLKQLARDLNCPVLVL